MRSRAGFFIAGFVLPILISCGAHSLGEFRVIPSDSNYLLRTPAASEQDFVETLRSYNGFVHGGKNGMELRPGMELRIENAYYEAGKPKRGLDGFLGTEIARYYVARRRGLKLVSLKSMNARPADQVAVQELISVTMQHYRFYRFYFEILFRSRAQGSVLIGADSNDELARLATAVTDNPEQVCGGSKPAHCVVFPEACSVAAEMEITVNGHPENVVWGSSLASVAKNATEIRLRRLYRGKLVGVDLGARDQNTLALPLLPGDEIEMK
jgi:hypothetical protein